MDQEKLEDLIPKLKKLFDQAPCGVGLFDSHGFHVFLNQTFFKMTGYSETELKQSGNNLDLLICPEDRKSTMDTLSKFWDANKPIEVEYRIVQKNGIHSWVRLDISMISLNGMKFAFAFLTDITEGKTKSIELEMIAQNSADSISIFRIKGKQMALEYANPKFFELLDTTPQQYHENEKHLIDASVSEEDYIRTSEAVNEAINTGKSGELLYQFRKNDGTVLWLDRRFAAIKQEDDAYLLVSTVSDVTSLVNSKQELAHKQKLYQLVIDQLHAAVFQWDHANGTYYSSEGYSRYAMSRISPDLILANKGPDDIYNHDDEPELLRFFKASKDGSPSAEAAIRMKPIDGSFRWCKLIGLFSYDQNGRSLRTVGIIIDINEEREKSFMLSQLIDEIPGGIAIFKVGQLLECPYFNEGFGKLTGWKGEELQQMINRHSLFNTLMPVNEAADFRAKIKLIASEGKTLNQIQRFINKDGKPAWIHISASKLREEDGIPVYYCIFTNPSTEAPLYKGILEDAYSCIFIANRNTEKVLYALASTFF